MIPSKKLFSLLGNLPQNLESIKGQLRAQRFEGSAAGESVKVSIDGQGCVQSIKINPACIDKNHIEHLEELLKKAFLCAHDKQKEWLKANSLNLFG